MEQVDAVTDERRVLMALTPVLEAAGAEFVEADQLMPSDVPIEWAGCVIGGVRLPPLYGSLERLLSVVEIELGEPLASLTREQQQVAIRRLDELGAFTLRRAVDDISKAVGISRITVYNYLNALYR